MSVETLGLVIWGGQQLGGYIFGKVLDKGLSKIQKDILIRASKNASKQFSSLIRDELLLANLTEDEIETYRQSLQKFISNKTIQELLGSAFNPNCQKLDHTILEKTWLELNLKPLFENFPWQKISKLYLKKVENIVGETQELKELFFAKKLNEVAENTKNLTGIIPDFDLERYRESILESYGYLKLSKLDSTYQSKSYSIKLLQIFIPQNVKEILPPSRFDLPKEILEKLREKNSIENSFFDIDFEQYKQLYKGKPSTSVLDVIKNEKYQYLVFSGDPGSGKSSLLQYLALDWAENPTEKIPLLIELQDYAKDENNPKDFLDYFHKGKRKICELNQHQLDEQLSKGNALVMFDGLDEILDRDIYGRIIKEIHAFSNKYKYVKIIVTSRIIGYNPDELKNAKFIHFTLEDFNDRQIRQFVTKWYQLALPEESSQDRYHSQERLNSAINDSPAIRQLARNPLLLTMMALLNRYTELPRRRIDLYEQATNVLLYQWDIEYKNMELTLDDVDLRAKQGMLRNIAYQMQSTQQGLKGNIIYRDDLEEVIVEYYYNRLRGQNSRTIAGKVIDQLRKRDFILCHLGKDYYGFIHRTFLEYFCATAFIEKFNRRGKQGGLTIEQLQEEVFGKNWDDRNWYEVLRLISGKLDEFVENIISYLIDIYDESKNYSALILASECLDEVDSKLEFIEVKNRLLDKLKDLLENFINIQSNLYEHKPTRQIAKNITLHWQNNLEVLEWLKNIALTHHYDWVRKEVARGMAEILYPEINNNSVSDIADIYFYNKEYDKALRTYLRLSAEKQPYGFNFGIGNAYRELKKYDEAIYHYQKWIEKYPHEINAYNGLGYVYLENKKYEQALDSFNKALEPLVNFYGQVVTRDDFVQIAITYLYWGKPELAIKTLIEATPKINSSIIYSYLGWAYHDLGEYDQAFNTYKDGLNVNSEDSAIYNNMAYLYFSLGKMEEAIESLEKALDIDYYYSNAHGNLGILYLAQNDLIGAENELNIAIELEPNFDLAILNLGTCYALKGDLKTAKKKWQEGLKIYPEYRQEERLYATFYTIAIGEKEQGFTNLEVILRDEQPPKGTLTQVLQIAYILEKCPKIEGIKKAIAMIENNIN